MPKEPTIIKYVFERMPDDRSFRAISIGGQPSHRSCRLMPPRPPPYLRCGCVPLLRSLSSEVMRGQSGDHILVIYLAEPASRVSNWTLETLCQARAATNKRVCFCCFDHCSKGGQRRALHPAQLGRASVWSAGVGRRPDGQCIHGSRANMTGQKKAADHV